MMGIFAEGDAMAKNGLTFLRLLDRYGGLGF